MSERDELVATVLRAIQRTADAQGNVTMLRAAENVADAVLAQREASDRNHAAACDHEWLDRPESDSRECLICGEEVFGG